jgi:beta-galactosidase/beta-glucuronidase
VKREAEVNVKRLRHHPSLVLLCGNNEVRLAPNLVSLSGVSPGAQDYQIAEAEGVYDSDSDKYAKTFPARKVR